MNTTFPFITIRKTLVATAITAALLAGCATTPVAPEGAADARLKLTRLQSDPTLNDRAPAAMHEATVAVQLAEQPESDLALAAHRVYLADREVEIARAAAETRRAEDQRAALVAQRETARLNARTREVDTARHQADVARDQAAQAQQESAEQRQAADSARLVASTVADAASVEAATAARRAADLQHQIDLLQARPTDRGLVLTLGDVLFVSGHAELRPGSSEHLNKLASFLNQYPERSATIEGYTDSVGTEDYNLGLSQRRADSVKSYLIGQGVASMRLDASGKGETRPVGDNASAEGRQQNRRVEVVISNPAVAQL